MSQFGTARTSLRDRCATYTSGGCTVYTIIDSLFARIIVALHRDPRFRNMPVFELELLLADTRVSAERLLIRELKDRIHLDNVREDLQETPAQLNEKTSHQDSMIEQLGE
jgi:hypothetical protein